MVTERRAVAKADTAVADTLAELREASSRHQAAQRTAAELMRARDECAVAAQQAGASIAQVAHAIGITKAGAQGVLSRMHSAGVAPS